MRNLKINLAGHLGDFALVAGAVLVAVGAGLIYVPAGLIAGGVLLMLGAILGGGGNE